MENVLQVQANLPGYINVSGATSDTHLIALWLHQKARRSENTKNAYEYEIKRFLRVIDKPLRAVTVVDMQRYIERLESLNLTPASQARALSTVRSLFSFAQKTGYIPFNVTQAVELPKVPVTTEFNFITLQEAKALLEALQSNIRDYTPCSPHPQDRPSGI